MITRLSYRLILLGAATLLLLSAFSAVAATNTVEVSGASSSTHQATAEELKPSACASLNLTNIVVGNNGSQGNDLILGSAGHDNNIKGKRGQDCIVAGGGNDTLKGGQDGDVLLAGPGNDRLNGEKGNDQLFGQSGDDKLQGGQGTDLCDGGSGVDTADASCESQSSIP